ncbi:DUF1758 domain-containing protein [Trichonephila clavipes]|nr:DUF1758 domain-containing protein [Trichonephila clavipes]
MAPKELSKLTVFNRRKAHLLGQITRIRNSLENVDSPLNQVEIRTKLASLSEVKAKIDKLRTESYRVLSDEELMDFEASLDTMEVDADNLEFHFKGSYENKRLIVNSHIAELLNPNKIKFESAFHLRSLIDSIQSHLRALKQLELEPNALCESMLIFVITQRLDDESRKQYEMELHSNDLPKLECGACISVRKRISAEISNGSSFKRKLNFLIVPKITGCVPTQPLDLTKIKLPQNITYADAEFNIPKPIDILLGGEIFYELLKSKQIKLHDNSIILQDSVFGYIVTGSIQNEPSNYYFCNFIQDQVDRNLTKFWDLEAIGIKAESSCDPDDQAMQHFKSSVRFNSGRYEVGFPWKGHTQELNDNFSVAEKRVKSLTRRFIRDPTLYIQYSEILKEYESQGIIERVLETENQLIEQYSIYRTKRSFAKKA